MPSPSATRYRRATRRSKGFSKARKRRAQFFRHDHVEERERQKREAA